MEKRTRFPATMMLIFTVVITNGAVSFSNPQIPTQEPAKIRCIRTIPSLDPAQFEITKNSSGFQGRIIQGAEFGGDIDINKIVDITPSIVSGHCHLNVAWKQESTELTRVKISIEEGRDFDRIEEMTVKGEDFLALDERDNLKCTPNTSFVKELKSLCANLKTPKLTSDKPISPLRSSPSKSGRSVK